LRQSSVSTLGKSKKKAMLASFDELMERMPSLLGIDHPCAQRQITDARRVIEVFKTCCILWKEFFCLIIASCLLGRGITWVVVLSASLCFTGRLGYNRGYEKIF
jgi:hypothetical protein